MANKPIGFRLNQDAVDALDRGCLATGKTRTELAEELLLTAYPGENALKGVLDKDVNSKCVKQGERLPEKFQINEHFIEKTVLYSLIVFPEQRVVAKRCTSANGLKRWLEVYAVYPEDAWKTAEYTSFHWRNKPVTQLEKATKELQLKDEMLSHPKAREAIAAGCKPWRLHNGTYGITIEHVVLSAEEYLADLAAVAPAVPEVQEAAEVPVVEIPIVLPEPEPVIVPEPEVPVLATDPTQLGSSVLSRTDFSKRFGLVGNAYNEAIISARKGYWVAPDGGEWTVASKGKNAKWSPLPINKAVPV